MNRTEFRDSIRVLLSEPAAELSLDEKIAIVQQCLIDLQEAAEFDDSNKGKPWTDEELRVVFHHAPTKKNRILLARAFRRG